MSTKLLAFIFICFYCISYAITGDESTLTQCYTCRGINCQLSTKQDVTETCIHDLDSCVTIFDKFAVKAKGCLLEIPVELRSKCNDWSNPECRLCNAGLCNNLGRKDFKCYQCNDRDDANCVKNISSLTPTQCKVPSAPNSYCFTKKANDGHVTRGCSLHVKDQETCLASENCVLCSVEDGQGCNMINTKYIKSTSGGAKNSAAVTLVMMCALVVRMLLKF